MKRRILPMIMAVIMIMSIIQVPAWAADGDDPMETADSNELTDIGGGEPEARDGNNVAQIGDTGYPTLQAAIDAAGDGQTVKLLENITESVTIAEGKDFVLELNGKTLSGGTASKKPALRNNGTVVIQDTVSGGMIRRDDHDVAGYYVIDNQGTMTIESGSVYNNTGIAPSGASLIRNGGEKTAKLTINGGDIKQDGFIVVKNDDHGDLTINGGTFTATGSDAVNTISAVQNWAQATITGGTFNGAIWTSVWSNDLPDSKTIIDGEDVKVNGKIVMEKYSAGLTKVPALEIKNGTFDVIWSVDQNVKENVTVTGGSFTSDSVEPYLADGVSLIANSDGTYSVDELDASNAAAEIGGQYYGTLTEAWSAALSQGTATITLLKDLSGQGVLDLNSAEANITVDLNGHDIGFGSNGCFQMQLGDLTLNGSGEVYEENPYYGPIKIFGNDTNDTADACVLTVNDGVTLRGWSAIFINGYKKTDSEFYANGVVVNINGATLESVPDTGNAGGHAIYVQGNIKVPGNNPLRITLNGANLKAASGSDGDGNGMYLAGYAETVINNSAITAGDAGTGIEIRAGKLTINGDTSVVSGSGEVNLYSNGSGLTTDNVALAVAQHTTKLALEVTINDGTFTGSAAFVEHNPQKNTVDNLAKIKLDITGGQFTSTQEGQAAVYSESKTEFISGGTFSSDPSAYVAADKIALVQNNGMYTIETASENVAEVVAGEPAVELGDGVPQGQQGAVKTAVEGIEAAGLTGEANSEANNNTVTAEQGKNALTSAGVTVDTCDTVTIVVQPYLDIEVNAYEADSSDTTTPNTMTLDITPMVRTVATTADVDQGGEIYLETEGDNTQNAAVVETAKELNVRGSITLTIPLPDGFANAGETVYIQHKDIYEYTATVENGGGLHITFVNPHGFSVFTLSTTSAAVAEVDGTSYTSFQAAVDAVENDGTIILRQNNPGTAVVNRAVAFDVETDSHTFNRNNITAASGYTLSGSGNHFVVTRTPVDPGDDDDDDNNNSGSSSVRRYDIEADAGRGGDISPDGRVRVRRGENQTFRITADDGYEIYDVEVDGESVGAVERYTFENVRTDHTISATFRQTGAQTEEAQLPFLDVAEGAWYYDAVAYCYENGIMDGTSSVSFAPGMLLNRAMAAQVLYNLADGTASTAAGFPDVAASAWYADAVNWAAANGYVTGYDNGSFGPEDSLTREQLAVILYRYAGSPEPTGSLDGFTDAASASDYAVDALRWAVGEGLLTGKDGGRLDPAGTASRAELAQILARFAQM